MGNPAEGGLAQVYEEIVYDAQGNPKGIIGELYRNGEVQFKINAVDTGVRGTDLFKRMMRSFGDEVKSIRGNWPSGTNKDKVNDLVRQGASLGEAVKQTWTARRAADAGFGTVTEIHAVPGGPGGPPFQSIEVLFEP